MKSGMTKEENLDAIAKWMRNIEMKPYNPDVAAQYIRRYVVKNVKTLLGKGSKVRSRMRKTKTGKYFVSLDASVPINVYTVELKE